MSTTENDKEFSNFIAALAEDEPAPAPVVAVDGPDDGPATPPPAPPPPVDEKTASKFAMIAKRELVQRKREEGIKAREAKLVELEKLAEQLSSEDGAIAWLETRDPKLYEKWTHKLIGRDKTPEPNEIAERALREVQAMRERETQREAQLTQAYNDRVFAETKADIVKTVSADPAYATIAAFEAEGEVWNTIVAYYQQHQIGLTVAEAAGMVEEALRAKYTRAQQSPHLKALGSTPQVEPVASGKRVPVVNKNTTVTQRMKSTAPRQPTPEDGDISEAAWERHMKRLGL